MTVKLLMAVMIACGITGMAVRGLKRFIKSLMFYTQLSNLAAIVSAALFLITEGAEWVSVLRYLAVCMLIMTCLVTIFILVPTIKNTKLLLWSRTGFLLHLVCPILNTVSYLFFEPHVSAGMIAVPAAATLIYGIIMIYLNYIHRVDGPYPFLRVHNQSVTATVIWIILLLVMISAIAGGVYWLSAII